MKRMFNSQCYKKPIPSDIINIQQLDFLSRALLREIISMCRNEPSVEVFWHGNKQFSVDLEHGQMILKVGKICKELKISSDMVMNRLKIINEIYTEIKIEGKPYGTIVTLKNYDSLIMMLPISISKTNSKQYRSNIEPLTSNKSVNTDKNVNIYKEFSNKGTNQNLSF